MIQQKEIEEQQGYKDKRLHEKATYTEERLQIVTTLKKIYMGDDGTCRKVELESINQEVPIAFRKKTIQDYHNGKELPQLEKRVESYLLKKYHPTYVTFEEFMLQAHGLKKSNERFISVGKQKTLLAC